ncbi:MAG: TonB family protein, partial [Pyrinomonadaceae bacterium]
CLSNRVVGTAAQEDKKMFEKLIESNCEGADFKNRRSYFMVSSLVVGALFLTAVVISIFAADFGLGSTSFELTQMLSPVEMAATAPEPLRQQPATKSKSQSQLPTRQAVIPRIEESPMVPITTSVVPNTQMSRPQGTYQISKLDTNPGDPGTSSRDVAGSSNSDPEISTVRVPETVKDPEPPPVKKDPPPVTKHVTQSLGVINGKASYLPKPIYSAAAKAVRASGKVDVQVLIDENGKVLSANAVSGHPLLRSAAEQAARNAKFTATYLSNVPVKVSGVIIYNFTM